MKHLIVILALTLSTACASVPLKQQAVATLGVSETALEASHDAERKLCSPTADQAKFITHCDGPGAATFNLTDAEHQQLARLFSAAFDAHDKAAVALKAWRAGDPYPMTLAEYRTDAEAVLITVRALFPASQDIVTQAQRAFDEVVAIAKLLGSK